MKLTRELIDQAAARKIVTAEQADGLWQFFSETAPESSRFTFTNVLYYFGGLIAIGAMTLFMTIGWQKLGGWGMFGISVAYAAGALWASRYVLSQNSPTASGILACLAIALVPLAIYGLQDALGMWPISRPYRDYHYWVDGRWAMMELGTLAAGTLILYFYRMPFAIMPIAVTLWYMSMDFAPLLAGGLDEGWKIRSLVSIVFGLLVLALALYVDVRSRRKPDYAFWLYIFGTLAFWGGLSSQDSGNQAAKFGYACLNAGMIFVGVILSRRIFTVCGALGLFGYLGYLSYSVFKDSIFFPIALSVLGLIIVVAGIWWQRRERELHRKFRGLLPRNLRETLETEA